MIENEHRDWKQPEFGEYKPTTLDWARMAAYLDGEGSILINPRRDRLDRFASLPATFYLKITVANTDYRLPLWLMETFGGSANSANSDKYNKGRNVKRCWHWTASANRAAWILWNCRPYFIIKDEQAEIGVRLQETMSLFTRGAGRALPTELVEERRELKRRLLVLKARGRTLEPTQAERIEEVS